MSKRRGRQRDSIWEHFSCIEGSRNAECNYCHKIMHGDPGRMKNHIQICDTFYSDSTSCSINSGKESCKSIKRQKKVYEHYMKPLRGNDLEKFYDDLVRALISSNVTWSFLQNKYLRNALQILRPSTPPLNRQTASGPILNRLYTMTQVNIANFIECSVYITLEFDGFTDITRKSITNHLAINEHREIRMLDIIQGSPKSSANDVKNYILALAKRYKTSKNLISICCDSSGVYFKARNMIKNDHKETAIVLVGGCLAHQTNLLLKDVINSVDSLINTIEKTSRIASAINRSPALTKWIIDELNIVRKKENKPHIDSFAMWKPTPTRWYSYAVCLKQTIKISKALRVVLLRDANERYVKISKQIKQINEFVRNELFWTEARDANFLLQPLNFATGISEMDMATSGQVIVLWIWLIQIIKTSRLIPEGNRDAIVDRIFYRMNKFFEDHQIVCWALDPRCCGIGLSPSGVRQVKSRLMNLAENLYHISTAEKNDLGTKFNDFMRRTGMFSDANIWLDYEIQNPASFWQGLEDTGWLAKIGQLVCEFVPHAASTERNWSSHANIHTKARNRLKLESVKKISIVKHQLTVHKMLSASDVERKYKKLLHPDDSMSLDALFGKTGEELITSNELYRDIDGIPNASVVEENAGGVFLNAMAEGLQEVDTPGNDSLTMENQTNIDSRETKNEAVDDDFGIDHETSILRILNEFSNEETMEEDDNDAINGLSMSWIDTGESVKSLEEKIFNFFSTLDIKTGLLKYI